MIIRLVIYLVLIYFAVRLIKGILAPFQVKQKETGNESEEMVKDPACGVYIPKKDAIGKKVKGERLFFCSRECYIKFKNSDNNPGGRE